VTLAPALGSNEDLRVVVDWLEDAYWNVGRVSRADIAAAHRGSCAWVGARGPRGELVATARAISDGAKHAWIYDVMVAPEWRGRRLGVAVTRLLVDHPAVRGARFVWLATRDAQGVYAKLGFVDKGELPPRPYTSTEMVRWRRLPES
jgi:ribosomal protein S18 acetylase RimI-like enzyme